MNQKQENKWVITHRPNPEAKLRLFCFPHAGGTASFFRDWSRRLPDFVEVSAVQYPGRETRWGETPLGNAADLAAGALAGLRPFLHQKPFAFFGHSLGSLISFETARLMRDAGDPAPRRMFISGRRAPPFAPYPPEMHGMSNEEFKANLGELNGTPDEILQNAEIMSLLLPMLRADFSLDETYRHRPDSLLTHHFSIYGGEDDFRVPEEQLRAWGDFTAGPHTIQIFPGDHFYLQDPESPMYGVLNKELEELR